MSTVNQEALRYPIGLSDFEKLIAESYAHIDKTILIKEIIDDGSLAVLITRPRRFGKTINMSMLYYFFAIQHDSSSKRELFLDSYLNQKYPHYVQEHQGKYPVIFVTFKDLRATNHENLMSKIRKLIKDTYKNFEFLLDSDCISDVDKERFQKILSGNIDYAELTDSLKDLTILLQKHYKQDVYLLIDEYDTPIQEAYKNKYYDELVEFMQSFLSSALKDNKYLKKAVLTGILRIEKESIFSGLNNLSVNTVIDNKYSEYFGFTESEVNNLIERVNAKKKKQDLITMMVPRSYLSSKSLKTKKKTYRNLPSKH